MSPMVSAIGLLAVVALSVFVPIFILKQAAQRSSDRNKVFLKKKDPRVLDPARGAPEEQEARLGRMKVWPLDCPREVTLLMFAVAAACTFFLYRLTFFLAATLVVTAVRTVYRLVSRGDGEPADARPAPTPPRAA